MSDIIRIGSKKDAAIIHSALSLYIKQKEPKLKFSDKMNALILLKKLEPKNG